MTEDILMRQYEYVYHKNERLMPKKLFVSNLRANRLCLGGYGELYLIDLELSIFKPMTTTHMFIIRQVYIFFCLLGWPVLKKLSKLQQ